LPVVADPHPAPTDTASDASFDPPSAPVDPPSAAVPAEVDLDAIERDLRDVETALNQLADGTYWTDGGPATAGLDPTTPPA
jgi:hypothetical protein